MNVNGNWQIYSTSIKGAVHESRNESNQDSYKSEVLDDNTFIFALADGHGSKKCFRSHLGSQYGVEAACSIVIDNMNGILEDEKLNAKLIMKTIPQNIIESWKKRIDLELNEKPITDEEIAHLTEVEKKVIQKNKYLAYGTTLIITFFIHGHIICWQLGDGNILFVSESKISSMPMGKDEKMIANETYSMCMSKADKYFNTKVFKDNDPMLRLIIVSSDGYSNSFKTEEGFLKVGTDILELIDEEGFSLIEEELDDWLTETMISGSGDDITAGIIFREFNVVEENENLNKDITEIEDENDKLD